MEKNEGIESENERDVASENKIEKVIKSTKSRKLKKKPEISMMHNDEIEESELDLERDVESENKIENTKSKEGFFSYNIDILKNNKKLFIYVFAGLIILYSFLYGLWKIPVIGFGFNRMSSVRLVDYLFIFGVSVSLSILVTFWKHERKNRINSDNKAGAIGGGSGAFLAGICPVCQSIALVALGSTFLTIPTSFLLPYLGILKTISLGLLVLAVYTKADSIYTKSCPACSIPLENTIKKKEPFLFRNNYFLTAIIILTALIFINQLMIPKALTAMVIGTGGTANIGNFEYGSKITLKPLPLATGEQPKIPGYKTKVKPLPTMSELPILPSTGDAAQDLLNNVVPKGMPWYGQEAGVSFDDPIGAQKLWAKGRAIQLSPAEQQRWERIANSFTCDYCCGSPQNPTIITRCGCAHSAAAQGMAKWFIKNYGDKYSDEEIYGEMARWYAVWYPKGTIERIILEAQ